MARRGRPAGRRDAGWRTLAVLVASQFVVMLDFLVMMPLAPLLMPALALEPHSFGWLVVAYSLGAAAGGVLGAFGADRVHRGRAFVGLSTGFAVAAAASASCTSLATLVAVRAVAGVFGGLLGALSLTIAIEAWPPHRRATAVGTVLAGVPLAGVLGVPVGLVLAQRWGWPAPFMLVAVLAAAMVAAAVALLPSVPAPAARPGAVSACDGIVRLLRVPLHRAALGCGAVLMFGTFLLQPHLATLLVGHLGVAQGDLAWVYLAMGAAAAVASPAAGWVADRRGWRVVFCSAAVAAALSMAAFGSLPPVGFWGAMAAATLLTVFVCAYDAVALAIVSTLAEDAFRGRFVSLGSACEQISMAAATLAAGAIVDTGPDGRPLGFEWLGFLGAGVIVAGMLMLLRVSAGSARRAATPPGERDGSVHGAGASQARVGLVSSRKPR